MFTCRKIDWVCCAALLLLHAAPAAMMGMPDFPGAFYAPYSGIYSLLSWLCIPALSSVVVIMFVTRESRCAWLPILETVLAVLVYAYLLPKKDAGLFCTGLILLLVLELFPLIQKADRIIPENESCKLLCGMVENQKFLALVYFWSVLFIFSVQWLLMGNSQYTSFGVVVVAGPLPVVMAILPGSLKKPLTAGGWLGVLTLLIASVCVCIGRYSGGCWGLYMVIVLIGFGLMSTRLWLRKYPEA